MNIVNINFTAIAAEKTGVPKGKVNVNNGIKLLDLEETEMGLSKDRTGFNVNFKFTTKYDPDFGNMELKGTVLLIEHEEGSKTIKDAWGSKKNIGSDRTRKLLNAIMNKCSLQIILLSRELGLPSPIPLPKAKAVKQD